MENITDKDPQDQPKTTEHASDERLAESVATAPGSIEARLQEQAATITRLTADLHNHKVALQDTEVALVTRIADVDDDRRDAALRLQRTLQAQRDELDKQFKRQRILIALLLLLFLLMIGALAAFGYFQLEGMRQPLVTDTPASRDERVMVPTIAQTDSLTREKLSLLSSTVEEISVSLERLGGNAPAMRPSAIDMPARRDDDTQQAQKVGEQAAERPKLKPSVEADTQTATAAPATTDPDPADTQPTSPGEASESVATTHGGVKIEDTPFTVQLLGFFSLDALTRFVDQNDLPAELYYQQTTYQGRPWYVLIHSLHETKSAAETTVANIPAELAKLDIWIRRLDGNQDIRRLNNTTR